MKYNYLIFLLFFLVSCSKNPFPDSTFALKAMFGSDEHASIVEKKMINLDDDIELEAVMVGRKGQEEVIGFFDKSGSEWQQTFNKHFTLLNLGPLKYDNAKNIWIIDQHKKTESFIFKKILFEELPGDNFNSAFLEILTEQPPIGLFSVPYVIRKNQVILNGLNIFAEHEKLKTGKRISFAYIKDNKSIKIFPNDPVYAQEFIFNGFEMLPMIGGVPTTSLTNIEITKIPESSEQTKKAGANQYDIILNLKNRGSFSYITYISLSFPNGENFSITDKEGQRLYRKGASIYSDKEKKYIPAEYPLFEITKNGWGHNYKYNPRFIVKQPDPNKKLLVCLRSSVKTQGKINNIPNEFSSVETIVDQQGFPCYKLEIDLNQVKK